jgi:hypothetical protein
MLYATNLEQFLERAAKSGPQLVVNSEEAIA